VYISTEGGIMTRIQQTLGGLVLAGSLVWLPVAGALAGEGNGHIKETIKHAREGIQHEKEAINHLEEAVKGTNDAHAKEALEHAKEAVKHAEESLSHAEQAGQAKPKKGK
jgi:hypothetical protein